MTVFKLKEEESGRLASSGDIKPQTSPGEQLPGAALWDSPRFSASPTLEMFRSVSFSKNPTLMDMFLSVEKLPFL